MSVPDEAVEAARERRFWRLVWLSLAVIFVLGIYGMLFR